jgi:hypothetical protein
MKKNPVGFCIAAWRGNRPCAAQRGMTGCLPTAPDGASHLERFALKKSRQRAKNKDNGYYGKRGDFLRVCSKDIPALSIPMPFIMKSSS